MPELFHFQAPGWFWLVIPLLLILWLLRRSGEQSSAWRKVCDARLLPFLLDTQDSRAASLPAVLMLVGGLLAIIALADPVWEQREQPVYRNEAARVIVLDLSSSMLSPDMKPSRMLQARYKVADILKQDLDGQTGLVAFAGDAFAVAPLTHDTDTIQALLSPLHPSLMPVQGSRVDLGLHKAAELLRQAGQTRGDIVLVTDGIDGERAVDAARQVAAQGYRVSVLAVGTDAGAPIPDGRGGFLRDALGEIVLPGLDQPALRELAAVGAGEYALISSADDDIEYLFSRMTADTGERVEQPGLMTDAWHSTGPLLAALLLPLAALAFRRGWLLVMLLVVGSTLTVPQPAMALGWNDLWLRPDQQASRALQAGDHEQAAALARDPALRGTAQYRSGDYESALESFAGQASVDADYNQGNALAQLQRYEEAIAAYDRALAQQPDMDDALHNKAEVERLLQQQQQQQQNQQAQGEQQDQQQGDAGEAADAQQEQQGGEQGQADARQDSGNAGESEQGQNGEQDEASAAESRQADASEQDNQQAGEAAEQQDPAQAANTPDVEQQMTEGTDDPAQDTKQNQQAVAAAEPLDSEQQRAAEQWLRRIPDDPAGLLRRKFLYQYNQRAGQSDPDGTQTW